MGAVISAENKGDVALGNDLLQRLASRVALNVNDPHWNKLFSFNFNLDQRSRKVQSHFLEQVNPLLEQLMHNTRETGNFATLIRVFNRRCGELEASAKCENKIFLWQAANSLLLIRFISAFFAQRLAPVEFAKVFGDRGLQQAAVSQSEQQQLDADAEEEEEEGEEESPDGAAHHFESPAEHFLVNLIRILTRIQVNKSTTQLHAETLRVFLSLLSTELYEDVVRERSEFLRLLMLKLRSQSGEIVRVLLENFLLHNSEPLDLAAIEQNGGGGDNSNSFVISLWSSLQRTLSFGSSGIEIDINERFPIQSLSSLSLTLLLSLVYYPAYGGQRNPFKHMLSIFQNAQEVSSLANLEASFKLDFSQLYNRLCQTVYGERQSLLLLYLLILNNIGFRNFVHSRVNLEQLVLPVIRVLFDGICSASAAKSASKSSTPSSRRNSLSRQNGRRKSSVVSAASQIRMHQVYLALIVLLMFSEDDFFKKVIHEMSIKNVDWFQPERAPISEVTLGGLIILAFSKTIQLNTIRLRDSYFHVNSLATLANLSSCFKQLSPMVCQKLIGLLESMTRRQSKLIRMMRENAERDRPPAVNERKISKDADDDFEGYEKEDLHSDISALEEGIRTLLEIINSCLCRNLRNNPDLIYTVLYKRELFDYYHHHPMFQDLAWNIYAVINHFTSRVDAVIRAKSEGGGGISSTTSSAATTDTSTAATPSSVSSDWGSRTSTITIANNATVSEILDVIKKSAIEWPTDRLKKFPELRFKYLEDDNTIDFFLPYIWRLVYDSAGIWFDPAAIHLFKPQQIE